MTKLALKAPSTGRRVVGAEASVLMTVGSGPRDAVMSGFPPCDDDEDEARFPEGEEELPAPREGKAALVSAIFLAVAETAVISEWAEVSIREGASTLPLRAATSALASVSSKPILESLMLWRESMLAASMSILASVAPILASVDSLLSDKNMVVLLFCLVSFRMRVSKPEVTDSSSRPSSARISTMFSVGCLWKILEVAMWLAKSSFVILDCSAWWADMRS